MLVHRYYKKVNEGKTWMGTSKSIIQHDQSSFIYFHYISIVEVRGNKLPGLYLLPIIHGSYHQCVNISQDTHHFMLINKCTHMWIMPSNTFFHRYLNANIFSREEILSTVIFHFYTIALKVKSVKKTFKWNEMNIRK